MQILKHPFGEYQTNCYIVKFEEGEFVVDAGMGADEWVRGECQNPLAFLNTHGHFDHIWSNASLKSHFPNTPLICHQEDAFLLASDCFGLGMPTSSPDILINAQESSQSLNIANHQITFSHYPGHTPGCCMIEIEGHIFSGDFIFYRSIGRSDFAYSDPSKMKSSLQRFAQLAQDLPIYPGHGENTSVFDEQRHLHIWLERL
ncbi:MBL fold metallo-hydrolase [Helicobacter enhydrae]|uniref:MBL fold metallo-hydrolase n=1 Tax=Helicobacter enhydrae TaxID=222136 RepID=A0A1B1U3N1_9HELI|nr:MBL fold metallo-hydrolase [Helicobacter enhydrae]ANV97342.1 MBL fold metallo-hydrolase [Helicobacter enhydrae]